MQLACKVLTLTAILTGAFTPVCSANHVPEYIQKLPQLREKGVDQVAVLAYNDAYVMSAWGKANGVTGDDIVSDLPSQETTIN
jgi:alkyl hydroperoxide reductase 1